MPVKKVKHTKNELKRQKDDLERFTHYLPMLVLKKQQLQIEIIKILNLVESLEVKINSFKNVVYKWVGVFAEEAHLERLISVGELRLSTGNIAGIDIPIFEGVDFKEEEYDYMRIPVWVDYGIEAVKELIILRFTNLVLLKQLELVKEELRITTQRVNLFEKIKMPEARENIRRIRIFLGDLQTAAVVTGKIAKAKIEKKLGEPVYQ